MGRLQWLVRFALSPGGITMWRNLMCLFVPVLVLAVAVPATAAEKKAFTDPDEAGPDFQVQGEYVGESLYQGKVGEFGAQVIALGDGKFHCVGYAGGLPGAGWDGSDREQVDGEMADGAARFSIKKDHVVITIKDGVMTVLKGGTDKVGELKKVERKSPTLGAEPPAGAVVLFDGTSPEAFKGGRMTEDGLLMEGATSNQTFGSQTIHIEFLLPFMPQARGQGRGNSGFYAQGRYEVQILDSFGLEGKNNECGGIYSVKDPDVNLCLPPLCWQTYDVEFTAAEFKDGKKVKSARMTVRHNGVVVHEDVEVPHSTTASPLKEGPEPGPVFFQNHGCPVRFRNIWVVEKK
jgi:hypothetical protein